LQSLLDGLVKAHKTLPKLQFPLSIASYQHYIIAADDPWKDESATVFWQQQVYIYHCDHVENQFGHLGHTHPTHGFLETKA